MTANGIKTLVVVHGNRYLEVFSNERHSVKIVNVPNMTSIAGELETERLVNEMLPPMWRNVYEGLLVDRDAIRDITPAELMGWNFELSMVQTLKRHIESGASPCTI